LLKLICPLHVSPGCRYTKGPWSDCDTTTNQRSRSLTLKKGDASCEQTKSITKPCKKGKRSATCRRHFHAQHLVIRVEARSNQFSVILRSKDESLIRAVVHSKKSSYTPQRKSEKSEKIQKIPKKSKKNPQKSTKIRKISKKSNNFWRNILSNSVFKSFFYL
jgi:PTN/MK heparin-binding protein family, C-terminal domain